MAATTPPTQRPTGLKGTASRRRAYRAVPNIVGIFVLVVISLQIFLLMVGLEAFLTYDGGLAWATASTSVALAACAIFLYRYLRGPNR